MTTQDANRIAELDRRIQQKLAEARALMEEKAAIVRRAQIG